MGVTAALAVSLTVACSSDDGVRYQACEPGEWRPCYEGDRARMDVGICHAGIQGCNREGTAWGPCLGYVAPQPEDCWTAADEDCDGQTPACPPGYPVVDLRADVNRNGTVDLEDDSEDIDEASWDGSHGAIFLANVDDDERTCPPDGEDAELASCHDAADERINGLADLEDLARLQVKPWAEAPDDAYAIVTVSEPARDFVRLFKRVGGSLHPYPTGTPLSADELRAGVELAMEGVDLVRHARVWDGYADVTLAVESGTGPDGPWPDHEDTVRLRQAPVIFRHHLHSAQTIYATHLEGFAGSDVYVADLDAAVSSASVPGGLQRFTDTTDQWTQDFLETAYMSLPAAGGQHVIHVNFRSPNYRGKEPALRRAGRLVFTHLRGPDVAGAVQFDPDHPDEMDSLNSFGNLETIPPFVHDGRSWPSGRVLLGGTPSRYPDPSFEAMIEAQGVQDVVHLDVEWLLVGHVDETVCFIETDTSRGWAMLVADPALAKAMLEEHCDIADPDSTPDCAAELFLGKWWGLFDPADTTIYDVLTDPDVLNSSAWAAVEIADQVTTLQQATGITPDELVPAPFLFQPVSGLAVAYQPNTVNSVVLNGSHFGAAVPHGPVIGGRDIFEAQLEEALAPFGITVHWIEDWDFYHRFDGDVHCGCNTTRQVPADDRWWEGF